DHTTLVSEDDPDLEMFRELDAKGIIQLRIIPQVGAERYAQFIYEKMNPFILAETDNRVRIVRVEFSEHPKNSAIFIP
ncbi:MAG: 6-carboxytetrahydropterin synthase, partial [Prolixibacteraceae bacterium]|nr:6-carboxytetrahydropterin synthase [Prolixibacteraceae bacterium]